VFEGVGMSPLRIWRLDYKFPCKMGPGSVVFLRGMYFFMQKMLLHREDRDQDFALMLSRAFKDSTSNPVGLP
jgi:hypothetical protein